MGNHDSVHQRTLLMRDIVVNLAAGASLSLTVTGCSVAMALSGNPEPNFKAIEGYTPPEPTGTLKEAVEAQEKTAAPPATSK